MSRVHYQLRLMRHAQLEATAATCPGAQVGAVIARKNVVVAMGYNGAPRHMPHCDDLGCIVFTTTADDVYSPPPRFKPIDPAKFDAMVNQVSAALDNHMPSVMVIDPAPPPPRIMRDHSRHVHAEANAIVHCARDGRSTLGCELYVTRMPCLACANLIIQAGIAEVYVPYQNDLDEHAGIVWRYLQDGGVSVFTIHDEETTP